MPPSFSLGALALAALPLLWACPVRADDSPVAPPPSAHPHAYAVVIGNNLGGAGQVPLHFAESDAESMAAVLRQLGHYPDGSIEVLLHPDVAHVLSALDDVAAKVRADAAHGDTSEVVFYYSGHARANAINLGSEDLSLGTLRERLTALPASLTLVVLDACQSGSFSRIKGAEPAADFTYNSVAKLTQKGLAVMASSTSEELSQESDELKSSYFTHHLVTGLRGAADADGDGRVSLDEAYKYAYRRTLASTAKTQVGEQHVTLETDLAGQGELPLTFPAEAHARLALPGPLEGRILVQAHGSGAVVAEVQKVPGPPLRLALVAGIYDAIVRGGPDVLQCRVTVTDDQVTVLDLRLCTKVIPEKTAAKGGERPMRERDRWALELGLGFMWRIQDSYTSTLQTFGYQQEQSFLGGPPPLGRVELSASRNFSKHVAGVIRFGTLASDTYQRQIENSTDTAALSAVGGALMVRAQTDVLSDVVGIYGQGGVGLTIGTLQYSTQQTNVPPETTTHYFNYLLTLGAGMTIKLPRVATLFIQGGYDHAPAIQNLIGDTHDSGGPSLLLGVRIRLGDFL
jgi:Caspase domain